MMIHIIEKLNGIQIENIILITIQIIIQQLLNENNDNDNYLQLKSLHLLSIISSKRSNHLLEMKIVDLISNSFNSIFRFVNKVIYH